MAIKPIVLIPDQRLKTASEPVTEITDEIRTLAADMLDTMYDAPGIGLAAVQIGIMKRLLVIDVAGKDEPRAPMVVINPEITWESDEEFSIHEEGCLSIPDYYEEVERPAKIRVRYMDLDGKTQEIEAEGILATCLQHEIDHLDGVLFIDYLSKLKRDRVMKKFAKAAKRETVG
ncbi:MAG: peptide deformylase [Chelatococcus sp.]|uniref:peptide deformylase n=1 Tax=unclassified Chelatococcus TaxID=2638111 RepID=UPI001BCB1453|nr:MULTISPECIES: peptide deformylase [unclassified Chelatococcus]CAH1652030.1 peptide deformylase [Hyphomicrobiales bacterium]MBS7739930.1 peptide deformylase [Chelatococcus sp. HY11]MBX3536629.1 peptide deformylase [Chelatococcus sp.]MBX3545634.1 peptide deformylase [Chelatococcus sp.]MCO5078770.1 peptide deformylase [Chelatococcus sp.]